MNTISTMLKNTAAAYNRTSLIIRILIGLVIGAVLAILVPKATAIAILGRMFVGALKAIAPLLVFVLVISSLARGEMGFDSRFGFVIFEYMISTLLAAFVAVIYCFLFPITVTLNGEAAEAETIPSGIGEVFSNVLMGMISNPVGAIADANFIAVLFWAVIFGVIMKRVASDGTKQAFADMSDIASEAVRGIINFAPFGIMGLVFDSVSMSGLSIFTEYGKLILLLVATMATASLVINPIIVFAILRVNPYPLVLRCIKESGLTAFFTRSSAANIPVNMRLCERLGLDKDMYSVSIPLGSTINMDGAAAVITVMTLTTVRTMGISVDLPSAIILSVIATLGACGTSGVAGGSLLLIPMACSLFGIPTDISMQMVGIGFIISVIQDSVETALNSSGDVVFTATAEYRYWQKQGKSLPVFLGGTTEVDV